MAMDGSSSLLAVLALDSHHDRLLAVVTDVRLVRLHCEPGVSMYEYNNIIYLF